MLRWAGAGAGMLALSATGAGFDTGVVRPGGLATVILDTPGAYVHACRIDPEMTGSIVVSGGVEARPEASPQASPKASPAAGAGTGPATVAIGGFAFDPPEPTVVVGRPWRGRTRTPPRHGERGGRRLRDRADRSRLQGSATFAHTRGFPYRCAFPDMAGPMTVA